MQWPPRWWEFCLLSLAPENPSLSSTPHCWLCHTQLSLTAATKSSSVPLLPSKGAGRRQHPRFAGAKLQNHRAGLCPSHGAWAAPHSQAHGAWSEGSTLALFPKLRWPQQRAAPAHLLLLLLSKGITKDKCKPGLATPEK